MADLTGIRRVPALSAVPLDRSPSVSIAPLEPCARYVLRVPAEVVRQLNPDTTLRLDVPINTCHLGNGRTVARLGPDEWLLLGPEAEETAFARDISAALAGQFFSLVDIGHRQTAIAVAGPHARDVLNGGCPLDLRTQAFAAGSASRTVLGKAEIVLLREGPEDLFRIECWRSFAPYVHALLRDVACQFP